MYALRHKSATLRAVKPRLEDLHSRAIALSIIEYLRLSNWRLSAVRRRSRTAGRSSISLATNRSDCGRLFDARYTHVCARDVRRGRRHPNSIVMARGRCGHHEERARLTRSAPAAAAILFELYLHPGTDSIHTVRREETGRSANGLRSSRIDNRALLSFELGSSGCIAV
jgi:hypothetical protein